MAGPKLISARRVAVEVLNQCEPKRNYAAPILDRLLGQTNEKQRSTDLVFGTLRNRLAIDLVIAEFSSRLTERIPAGLLNIIRVAACELIYNPQTPDYSIVNEAVESAKKLPNKKQSGFVNAVLRQITRHITNRQSPLADADVRAVLPQTAATGCAFDTPLLPDPDASGADYLTAAFSLPKWLVAGWLSEFGFDQTRQVCLASNRRPSIYIRPNTLKTTAEQLSQMLRQADIDLEIVGETAMIRITAAAAVTQLPGFTEGLFTVQDLTASHAARMLNPQPGWKILDLCAAPGTKTTQLAELTGDSAEIIATDIDGERLRKVGENTARLATNSVRIIAYEDFDSEPAETNLFDAILLDAPCSNSGVLAKRTEARYRINPDAIKRLTAAQRQLLQTAAAMIKPGGKICYSTCSIQEHENSNLIRTFLQQYPNFTLESERLTLPAAENPDHDGGYTAVIIRK